MSVEEDTHRTRTTSYGWMIQQIARRLNQSMEERLAPHGLNLQQFAVMMTVLEFDGLTQTEIGARFSMPPYAISRAIDHLEKAGFVARRQHPTSRRAFTVHATQGGSALAPSLHDIVNDVNAELTAPLTTAQREQLGALLQKLI
ncbi:MarR family winged helix-turn-helix transcriptional regulator [Primorskyibacter sp. S187A]|uniref:MarR family winged helix-turn-helix transcriptional regulator n=1 Tax=Primorskyibacter sp. S187A TaxID=3415130 RepID=UPI003C7CC8B3